MSTAGAATPIEVRLNGEPRRLDGPTGLLDLLASLGVDARAVAVELNGAVLPRARFSEVTLVDGDQVEVVRFVQGG